MVVPKITECLLLFLVGWVAFNTLSLSTVHVMKSVTFV